MSDEPDDGRKVEQEPTPSRPDSVPLDHAWAWFKYHAEQRLTVLRFYILVIGGLATAVGVLHQQKEAFICVLASVFAAFVCFCFMRFDNRSSDLVHLGEGALRSEQRRLAILTKNDDFEMTLKADQLTGGWPYAYGRIIRALLGASLCLFVLFAAISAEESTGLLAIVRDRLCSLVQR